MRNKILFLISLFVSLTNLVSANVGNDDYSHHIVSGMMGTGFIWFYGWIFMILILIVLILFIAWLIKQLQEEPKRKNEK